MILLTKMNIKRVTYFIFLLGSLASNAQIKALVGGTLIDGFGSTPILNSVIIIDGTRIVLPWVQ